MAYPDFSDICTTGHPVISAEFCRKAGIAHTCPGGDLLYTKLFRIMAVDIFCGRYKRALVRVLGAFLTYSESFFVP